MFYCVGYIKIDIPWTSLFSASVVAHLDDVYILAGPITDRMYDAERERALQNAIKREMLESLEASAISKVGKNIPALIEIMILRHGDLNPTIFRTELFCYMEY